MPRLAFEEQVGRRLQFAGTSFQFGGWGAIKEGTLRMFALTSPRSTRFHARFALIFLAGVYLPSCSLNVLNPAGPVGTGNATILINATVIMLAIVIPTILLAFWTAWRYRASNLHADYLPYWSYSGRIEAVVWSIPILTIMFIGGLIWIGSHRLDPFRPLASDKPPMEVQAVSLDWKWLFIYPQQKIATVNQLVMPRGTPVHFSITSASVFNAFFVPRLGSMIYAGHGLAIASAGGYAGQTLGYLGTVLRRWLFRYAI